MQVDSALLLLGLFFLAAALGWAAARFTSKVAEPQAKRLDPDYFRGINYLLADQPEKALDVFVQLLDIDTDSVETHLALGSLYRMRGEVDRAIRIHQNIIARPNLSASQRSEALFALAIDFLRAGLFDRAEGLFLESAAVPSHRRAALRELVKIYEQQRDWQQAINVRNKLLAGSPSEAPIIAHYYCELAEEARARKDVAAARGWLRKARGAHRRSIRAHLILAELNAEAGEQRRVLKDYRRVLEQDGSFVFEVLPRLRECFAAKGGAAGLDGELEGILKRDAGIRNRLAFAGIVQGRGITPTLARCIRGYLESQPMLLELLGALGPAPAELADDLTLGRAVSALHAVAVRTHLYRCGNCGYASADLYWQCPTCKVWDATRPVADLRVESIFGSGYANKGASA